MTRNQLQYHANREQQRHNLATESEAFRHNLVSEAADAKQADARMLRSQAAADQVSIAREKLPYELELLESQNAKTVIDTGAVPVNQGLQFLKILGG